MTPDQSVGRIRSADEAIKFFKACIEAEKVMGPLSKEEKMVILKNFGKDVTQEDLMDMIKGKRVLRVKHEEK
jgi:hypothetical protein